MYIVCEKNLIFMDKTRNKLSQIKDLLPLNYEDFKQDVLLPEEENFEFCYLQTLLNLLKLFNRKNCIIIKRWNKLSAGYHVCSHQKFSIESPDDKNKAFDVVMEYYCNGVGDDVILKLTYDQEIFRIESTDGSKLHIQALL